MWYDVKFSCGHEERIELFGRTREREEKIKFFERVGECSVCYKARKNKEAAQGCVEVEMHYGEYKKNYAGCKTKESSYNPDTKTIVVYVPDGYSDSGLEIKKPEFFGNAKQIEKAQKILEEIEKTLQEIYSGKCYELKPKWESNAALLQKTAEEMAKKLGDKLSGGVNAEDFIAAWSGNVEYMVEHSASQLFKVKILKVQ